MNQPTETEFDELPEALRLELFDLARREIADRRGGEVAPLSMRQIGDAAAVPRGTLDLRFRIALLKLRQRAHELEL